MADYRELLRKAVEALPENNGASRRQVYEKARSALVAQLRAINPPLPARDITQHRLQLEDCIRQVEQQATDALLGGLQQLEIDDVAAQASSVETPVSELASETEVPEAVDVPTPPPEVTPEPVITEPPFEPPVEDVPPEVDDETAALQAALRAQEAEPEVEAEPEPIQETPEPEPEVIVTPAPEPEVVVEPTPEPEPEPTPSVVVETPVEVQAALPVEDTPPPPDAVIAEAVKAAEPKAGSIDYLIGQAQAAADKAAVPTRWKTDGTVPSVSDASSAEAAMAIAAASTETINGAATAPSSQAMSAEREVEVEPLAASKNENDPQDTIDRAIETLDREARGESTGKVTSDSALAEDNILPGDMAPSDDERGGSNAVTIFLLLFALLLTGVGGAGFWAWREGYIDLDTMFAQGATETQAVVSTTEPVVDTAAVEETPTGPGNTTATPDAVAPVSEELGNSEERLVAETPRIIEETPLEPALVVTTDDGDVKSEERLPTQEPLDNGQAEPVSENGETVVADSEAAPEEVVAPIGAQSLLLEASSEGTTGAVPFSGTVDWSRGVDELGEPTLLATANIPARNLSVNVLIRRNADLTLPASHLMEVDFSVTDSFVGGAIAGLPGILLKNEELVRGVPLVGASARVVGNSFLFALSAAEQDVSTNTNLLQSRKWMDLAMVYATGNRAIITLEKDDAAQAMFDEVMATWVAAASQ